MVLNKKKIIPQTTRNTSIGDTKEQKSILIDHSESFINFNNPFSMTDYSQLVSPRASPRQKVERPIPFSEQISLIIEEPFISK